jgi:predicted CXXCH cytochrome family protein
MKTLSTIAIVVLFVLLGTASSFAQIAGSKHDFSGTSWTTNQEICLPCHTPHNAKAITDAPLWNHQVTTSTFSIYTGYALQSTVGQPDGSSKLCLSCHDGTVALENFGTVTNGTTMMSGLANFGTDLSNDHPISFVFDAALAAADGELHNPTTQTSGLGGTITDDLLDNTRVQCSSCHDPHNKGNLPDMLRKSNTASALCLTCHNK